MRTRNMSAILATISVCILLLAYSRIRPDYISENKMAYQNTMDMTSIKTDILHTKEIDGTIYHTVNCRLGTFLLTPEDYAIYIGEDARIDIPYHYITLYSSDTIPPFHDFRESYYFKVVRYAYPWEKSDTAFTESELLQFKKLVIDTQGKLESEDIPFPYDEFSFGHTDMNCLKDGAQRFFSSKK